MNPQRLRRAGLGLAVLLTCIHGLGTAGPLPAQDAAALPPGGPAVVLSAAEEAYLSRLGPLRLAVDPDWEPYEWFDQSGRFRGIAADLLDLIARRLGLSLEIIRTKDWSESIELSRNGGVHGLGFLNRTPAREAWLVFTEPYFSDPNVFITREEHAYIFDPRRLSGESIVFPEGTSVEEQVRLRFPNLRVLVTGSEAEALTMVLNRNVDMTLRSLTVAAYIIRKQGLFDLKISGQLDDLTNNFRIGLGKDYQELVPILNRGIVTLTPQDVQDVINRYISIEAETATDWRLVAWIVGGFSALLLSGALFYVRLQALNRRLLQREAELVATKEKLEAYSGHLRLVIDTVPAYIYAKNTEGRFILANKLFARLFNTTPEEVVGRTNQDYGATAEETARFNAEDLRVLETGQSLFIPEERGPRPDHQPGWFQTTKIPYRHPDWDKPAILGVSVDITEQRDQAELIRHMAQHDGLTGLPNRALFSDLLEQALAQARRQGSLLALLFIDLDGFKPVNDTYGHASGDLVLRTVAQRLKESIRQSDAAGRIGGDEFIVFLANLETAAAALVVAGKILDRIKQPVTDSEQRLSVGASIGVALFPEHARDGHTLMQAADTAMYEAKRGRSGISLSAAAGS